MNFTNISSNYQNQARLLNISFCAFNINQDSTRIYYSLNPAGLLFQKDVKNEYYFAQFQVKYELFNVKETKKIVDSASFIITDSTHYKYEKNIIDSFNVFTRFPSDYILALTITDLNKKYTSTNYLNILKSSNLGRNSFIVRDKNNSPLMSNCVRSNQQFFIEMNGQQVYKLYVKYFSREFLPAEPPFTIVSSKSEVLRPDTIFTIDINNEKSNLMTLTKPGIYHFQADTSKKEGFTLFHFYEDFPLITNAEQMLYPLKYITTKNEFNDLLMMKNIKSTIDAFWLEKAGNAERAREMIKVYYNRVQDANRFFTSYTEGWKTDRGIIYVVFGPPYSVYRSPFNETWNYGEDRNIFSMTMDFNKTDNPYTDNDYTLSRSPEYKDVWYSAVESWRR